MKLKKGVELKGLLPGMRPVLVESDRIWKALGIADGVTITETLGGLHSPGSFHYYGGALDLRSRYFSATQKATAVADLKRSLPGFDVIAHDTHIHVEPGPMLARAWGLIE